MHVGPVTETTANLVGRTEDVSRIENPDKGISLLHQYRAGSWRPAWPYATRCISSGRTFPRLHRHGSVVGAFCSPHRAHRAKAVLVARIPQLIHQPRRLPGQVSDIEAPCASRDRTMKRVINQMADSQAVRVGVPNSRAGPDCDNFSPPKAGQRYGIVDRSRERAQAVKVGLMYPFQDSAQGWE